MENQSSFDSFELQISNQAISALKESAKWCYFLAILGFIGIGFLVLAAIFVTSLMSMIPQTGIPENGILGAFKGFISFLYIIIAVLYFFPVMYLFKYASKMKKALSSTNTDLFTDALINLKSHHKFLGITALVVISLYGVIFIIAIIATVATHI